MPKQPKRETGDVVQNAHRVFQESLAKLDPQPVPVDADTVSRVMRELGRRGGKVGGKARAASMTKERRIEIATSAAKERWAKRAKTDSI